MDEFEALAKMLMKDVRREMSDNYYFRHGLDKSNEVVNKVTVKLAKALEEQYDLGREEGQRALVKRALERFGGHK